MLLSKNPKNLMKLRNVRSIGRYKNTETSKEYNIKKGTKVGRSTTHYYYLYRGSRILINDKDFFDNYQRIDKI